MSIGHCYFSGERNLQIVIFIFILMQIKKQNINVWGFLLN